MGTVHRNLQTNHIMNKFIIFLGLVSACAAAPQGAAKYPAVEDLPPQPYGYQYGVEDEESKASFQKSESQDAKGSVLGQYVIALPDGLSWPSGSLTTCPRLPCIA